MTDDQHGVDSPKEPVATDPVGVPADAEAPDERDPLKQSGAADHFYKGVIASVHWGHERGAIRSVSGREIQFEFPFVTVVGERRSVESLHPGMRVGFDVGQTSGGLRVTTLKVYD